MREVAKVEPHGKNLLNLSGVTAYTESLQRPRRLLKSHSMRFGVYPLLGSVVRVREWGNGE